MQPWLSKVIQKGVDTSWLVGAAKRARYPAFMLKLAGM